MKKQIEIYKDWCKKCGICVGLCPKKVLEMDEQGYPYAKDLEKCTECGLCEIRCPDFAVIVSKNGRVPQDTSDE